MYYRAEHLTPAVSCALGSIHLTGYRERRPQFKCAKDLDISCFLFYVLVCLLVVFYYVIRIQVALWDVWFCLFFLFTLKAKILCTNLCKCTGCKNFEESPERKTLMHLADAAGKWPDQNSECSTSWKIVCFVFQYAWLSLACVADIQRVGEGKIKSAKCDLREMEVSIRSLPVTLSSSAM